MNCRDFLELHEAGAAQSGIVCIYQDRDPRKNMTFARVVTALANLAASGWDFTDRFVALNAWDYRPACRHNLRHDGGRPGLVRRHHAAARRRLPRPEEAGAGRFYLASISGTAIRKHEHPHPAP